MNDIFIAIILGIMAGAIMLVVLLYQRGEKPCMNLCRYLSFRRMELPRLSDKKFEADEGTKGAVLTSSDHVADTSAFSALKSIGTPNSIFAQTIAVVSVLLFLTLLLSSLGLTGSSLGHADQFAGVHTGVQPLLGKPSTYRGDEWGVITPAAIAQTTHVPPFPVINTNMGVNGTNMLLIHMTGVPVWHVASLVKPPVWGFFITDIRHALAWYWWAPIFLSLVGIFVLLQTVWRGQTCINLTGSALFTFSMHATAFSYWPGYVAGYCCLFAAALIALFREKRIAVRCLYALGAAWSLAGAILTLYIPWVVPLLFLVILVILGVFMRERLYLSQSLHLLWPAGLAFAIVLLLVLVPWFLSSREAITAVMASSYPGGRLSLGGDWPWWGMAKGWLSLTTFHSGALMMTGEGYNLYPNLFVPLLALWVCTTMRANYKKTPDTVLAYMLLLMAFVMVYQYIGIPSWLAKATLWTRTHGFAAEVGFGLAQMFLLVGLCARKHSTSAAEAIESVFSVKAALGITLVWGIFILVLMFDVPRTIDSASTTDILYEFRCLAALLCLLSLSFLLLRGRIQATLVLLTVLTVGVTLWYNPLSVASPGIKLDNVLYTKQLTAPSHVAATTLEKDTPLCNEGRTAFLEMAPLHANLIRAAGVKTLNGVLFYADSALQDRFYDKAPQPIRFYKYNHLMLNATELPAPATFHAEAGPDWNKLFLDAHRFNFDHLFVDYVVLPAKPAQLLVDNTSLQYLMEENGFVLFRVLRK